MAQMEADISIAKAKAIEKIHRHNKNNLIDSQRKNGGNSSSIEQPSKRDSQPLSQNSTLHHSYVQGGSTQHGAGQQDVIN